MRHHLLFHRARWATLVFAAATLFSGGALLAQSRGLVSSIDARRIGLERSWFTQINVDSGRGELSFVTPYVSHAKAFTIYEVVWETGKLEFSELERDPFGQPRGAEEALKAANAKIEELTAEGLEPKLITSVVPEISLYASTNRGVVHAIDGETGRTRWSNIIGSTDYPTLEPGVNEDYVAVVNGSTLYVVERGTGVLAWERRLSGAPGAGPAVSDEMVFVPLMNGKVEAFKLTTDEEDEELERKFRAPITLVSIGDCYLQPTVTPSVCAWVTDRGFMYVVNANKEGMLYRTEADDTVVAPITYDAKGRSLMMASIDGYVYNVDETSGAIIWRFSTGSPIASSPHVVGDSVFVVTDKGGLFCVDAETGLEQWWTPRVKKFLAGSKDRVYCTDQIGRLLVIDAKNGGRIASLPTEQLDFLITNHATDRIYVGTKSGLLQCLHEPQLARPLVYSGPGQESTETKQVKVGPDGDDAGGLGTTPAASDDPFGTGGSTTTTPSTSSDPFGTGGSSPPASDDPFGTGGGGSTPPASDDPFGTGGAAASDSPFG
ncbi:MAG: PQQ-binding-like beta-propeller repeat protein [Pirellulaceae bacterium]